MPPSIRLLPRDRPLAAVLALAATAAVPLLFVLHTQQIWEDFFITYRHSENLVRGHGLVFTPGERVHGFTSPLNTLLPALFAWVTSAEDYRIPLAFYRIVSLAALLGGLAAIARVVADGQAGRVERILCGMFPLLVVLEVKITAYAMNGQEAGLMVGFLSGVLVIAYRGWPRADVLPGALCLAGLMYTRPDGFVFAATLGAAGLVFCAGSRRDYLASLLRSAGIGALLYLPWPVFAQLYYGSFVPHTVTAKHGTEFFPSDAFGLLAPVAAVFAKLPERLCGTFAAIYDFQNSAVGGWPKWLHDVAFLLAAGATTWWLVPTTDRLGRMASLGALVVLGYLTYASTIAYSCPWYYPPLSFLCILALVRAAVTLPAFLRAGRAAIPVSAALVAGLAVFLGFIFLTSLRGLKLKQEVIDGDHRRNLGLWLRDNVADRETVYLEPIGYIGYFSQRRIRDWPGLVSPEVVAIRRELGRPPNPWGSYYWAAVAERLRPDWIVARPVEEDQMRHSEILTRDYVRVRVFNVAGRIEDAGIFPGAAINFNDAVFTVYRRRPAGSP